MSALMARLREVPRSKIVFALLSVFMTVTVVVAFFVESRSGYSKPGPQIIYFDSWKATRTREDAIAEREVEVAKARAAQERDNAVWEADRAERAAGGL